jgi:asparagine synthase (glutamine-hydrolysing)
VPREIVYRRKRGWHVPMAEWLRGDLRAFAYDVLLDPHDGCAAFLNEKELRRLLDEHVSGTSDRTRELFALLSLGLWHGTYIAGGAVTAAA